MTTFPVTDDAVLVDGRYDQSPRWHDGERFHTVFEEAVDRLAGSDARDQPATEVDGSTMTYDELDRWANRLARRFALDGIADGDRVGLLFDRSPEAYASMLALSKAGAAWVPLDTAFPPERLRYIAEDAGIAIVLTRASLTGLLDDVPVRAVAVDDALGFDDSRIVPGRSGDALAYIVYTSGTTGRPKGVPIEHSAICNFIRVAAELYGYGPGDRVYQGLTIAFDFSIEEIWVPLAAGATLVPAPSGRPLVGEELSSYLQEQRISALCCVPTLLATVDPALVDLRLVIVSGEACPRGLVERWTRPDRRLLNVYGPTEATVTATWTELRAGSPVTIGLPLPTYRVVLLDPASGMPVRRGSTGELAISGIGLSPGYLGRDDLTAKAFVVDLRRPLGDPMRRLYRTGDLARIDDDGQLVYQGRIDSQVKIRGYRIELDEIESVLLGTDGVTQAAVTLHRPDDETVELAAFYTSEHELDPDSVMGELRRLLPPFMVPAYLARLATMPMTTSDKVDRRALPAPVGPRYTSAAGLVEPEGPVEVLLARELAQVLQLPALSVEADVFTDLGADSLRIARFCGAVRETGEVPALTTRTVYEQRSVRAIAAALATTTPDARTPSAAAPPHRASRAAHLVCGAAQAVWLLLVLTALGVAASSGYTWLSTFDLATQAPTVLGAAVLLGAAAMLCVVLLPVGLKWALLGRAGTEPIPVWGARYLRFWIVRVALRTSPVALLAGSPLYNAYLRLLGARVGRHALVLAPLPAMPDMVDIGAGAVVREGAAIDGYRADGGRILPGRVVVGPGAVVGEGAVLDIDTVIGRGAQLAHASALLSGQRIPDGRRWHGTPAEDAGPAVERVPGETTGSLRRGAHGVVEAAGVLLLPGPTAVIATETAVVLDVVDPLRAAAVGLALVLAVLVARTLVPRLVARLLVPGRDYRLYGMHWSVFRLLIRAGNSRFFNELFGDSSAVLGYLRALGYRLPSPVQTGSNFGTEQRQHVASLVTVGGGSLISDGLFLPNGDYTAESFRVRPIRIGERVFMGNGVVYPPDAAVGDDVLLATKVMVPTDGPIRSGVGLLGSPAFEIPRTVDRDRAFDEGRHGDALRTGLARKNRHNLVTALLFLLYRLVLVYVPVLLIDRLSDRGPLGLAASLVLGALADLLLLVLVDWASRGFRRLAPITCSLYDARFWRHERYWKLADPTVLAVFDGTPFKALLWRLLGVRCGRMLFDDGAFMPERSLVTLGDHVTLGARSVLHGHSLEDGAFKSGRIELGSDVSVGPSALVHYDVRLGDGTAVLPDAFLMKGEETAARSVWSGNPAVPVGRVADGRPHPRVTGHRVPAGGRRRRSAVLVPVAATVCVLVGALPALLQARPAGWIGAGPTVRATPPAHAAGPSVATVSIIGDDATLGRGGAAGGWPARAAAEADVQLRTTTSAAGYLSSAQSYADHASRIDPDSTAIVFIGTAADAGGDTLGLLEASTRAFAAATRSAPGARVVVVGPFPTDGASPPADMTALRDALHRAAAIVGATWVDPIAAGWFTGSETGDRSRRTADRMSTVIGAALRAHP